MLGIRKGLEGVEALDWSCKALALTDRVRSYFYHLLANGAVCLSHTCTKGRRSALAPAASTEPRCTA